MTIQFKVIQVGSRFAIADINHNILDNGHGYYYKTAKKAYRAGWWLFTLGNYERLQEKHRAREFYETFKHYCEKDE